jgi:hypothetical protein
MHVACLQAASFIDFFLIFYRFKSFFLLDNHKMWIPHILLYEAWFTFIIYRFAISIFVCQLLLLPAASILNFTITIIIVALLLRSVLLSQSFCHLSLPLTPESSYELSSYPSTLTPYLLFSSISL